MAESSSSVGKVTSILGRAARRVLWSLPEPVKVRLSSAYRTLRLPAALPSEVIEFPADIADRDELMAFLADTDIFGAAPEEGQNYLSHALERFRITLAITPPVAEGAKVLELGANPYFFTRMLERRGIDVTCANWFGESADIGSSGTQEVASPGAGISRTYRFEHFDIETSRFPYEDEAFDLVFFCEIIEHLPLDPVNALAEIHRVLRKPGGVLVLSTPNPARSENLLKMLEGENVYEPLSGYGVHGRHNREYTVAELRELLGELGYGIERIFTADVSPAPPSSPRLTGVELADRGEYVFLVARAIGADRWRYPPWLYQSRHALTRAVLPDLEVGRNDDLQSHGFHDRETIAEREIRWLGKAAEVLLSPVFEGRGYLRIEGIAPPEEAGEPLELRAEVSGRTLVSMVTPGQGPFVLRLPVLVEEGDQRVSLSADRTWRPVDMGLGADRRDLSVAISAVGLESESD